MSHTVTGRYRKEAQALARAKGEESTLNRDVYNYGDMLFQEAEITRQKRDEWRSKQLRDKAEAEVAEATFQPHTSRAGSVMSSLSGADEPLTERELLERIDRQERERHERARSWGGFQRTTPRLANGGLYGRIMSVDSKEGALRGS